MSSRSSSVFVLMFCLLPGCMVGSATAVDTEEALEGFDESDSSPMHLATDDAALDQFDTQAPVFDTSPRFGAGSPSQGTQPDSSSPFACDDQSAEQVFARGMYGCGGSLTFEEREEACAPGWHVCSTEEWIDRSQGQVPSLHYWTDDVLGWSTSSLPFAGLCTVTNDVPQTGVAAPRPCPGSAATAALESPMRVCAGSGADRFGNECEVAGCSFETSPTVPATQAPRNFGGCGDALATAGSLCCR